MIKLSDLAKISKKIIKGGEEFKLEVDNRQLNADSIFIAIVGDRFDPLMHLDKVVDSGCRYVIFEENIENNKKIKFYEDKLVFIPVTDIFIAIQSLGEIVADYFKKKSGKIIAISGSNGKTTTKEMLNFLLKECMGTESVICTQKNNNNHLGVPFTLFQISKKTKYAIVELGSNHPGEIEHLAKMIQPQIGYTTNIGDTHLEFFETRENVFLEESILYKYCSENFLVNSDDYFLKNLDSSITRTIGEEGQDYKFEFKAQSVMINEHEIKNDFITGRHNFFNLAAAFVIANYCIEDIEKIITVAKNFKPTHNRSQWITKGRQKIFLDAYNANPSSMRLALLGYYEKLNLDGVDLNRVLCIFGDMNELGSNSNIYHEEIGLYVNQLGFKNVAFVGRFSGSYAKGFGASCLQFESTKSLVDSFSHEFVSYENVFIKGSRSLQLELITDITSG